LIDKPFKDLQKTIQSFLGIDSWEIIDEGNHALDGSKVDKLLKIQRAASIQFTVHCPFVDVNIATPSQWLRVPLMKRLERSLRFASQLRAECYTLHPGLLSRSVILPEKSWDLNIQAIKSLLKTARRLGLELAIENMPRSIPFLLKTTDDFKRFFAEFDDPPNITLDIGHANTNGELPAIIKCLRERIFELHIHDNQGDDEHKPVGEGSINWKVIQAYLKGFRGPIVIESVPVLEEEVQRVREIFS
jgi:sugar phosphate isomerase/epimerase